MQLGTVKNIDRKKRFGFIRSGNGEEFFFHESGCAANFDTFEIGEKVLFEPTSTPKGLRAENVRYADE